MYRIKVIKLMTILFMVTMSSLVVADETFPLRSKYSGVAVYSTQQLNKNFDKVIIVDVRSHFEYSIVHINGSVNNPVMLQTFLPKLEKLRMKFGEKKIIFYCNGHTCSKSYKAARQAMEAGYKNVYAYDSGVFAWVKRYPQRAMLMGRSPVPKNSIITKLKLTSKKIDYNQFRVQAAIKNSLVIDVRDPAQRNNDLNVASKKIYLDKLVGYLKAGVWKDRKLLIYDAVGKQVRWLQYFLVKHGYTDYYFLSGGVRAAVTIQSVK